MVSVLPLDAQAIEEIDGALVYVNVPPETLPPAATTVATTDPTVPAGETAVIEVAELTVKLVALTLPNLTAVTPEKFVPVIVTVVPPTIEPEVLVVSEVMVGADT